jgi:hypothetical protein
MTATITTPYTYTDANGDTLTYGIVRTETLPHKVLRRALGLFAKLDTALQFALPVAAALIVLLLTQHHAAAAPTPHPAKSTSVSTTASTFDDGYRTAMQDACQQHAAYACQWLKTN